MNRRTVPFILCLVLFSLQCHRPPKDDLQFPKKMPLQQRIEGRITQERDKTIDPHTGTVPSERLAIAREYIAQKFASKGRTAIPHIDWMERGPSNVSGRSRTIMVDSRDATGNTVFAGGVAGGIWKSTNGGATWTIINNFYTNMAVTSIVQDPINPDIIYFGTGEVWAYTDGLRGMGIYKSTNGGNTFNPISSTVGNKDFEYINKLAVQNYQGSTVLYAATSSSDNSRGGLMITQNGGSNWLIWKGNNSGINNFASDVEVTVPDPNNNNQSHVIAAFGGGNFFDQEESDGLWLCSNGGLSWSRYYTAQSYEGRIDVATSSNPYINYIFCENLIDNANPTLYGTFFTGVSYNWVPIGMPTQGHIDNTCTPTSIDITRGQDWYDIALAVSPANPFRLMIGGVDLWLYERDNLLGDHWLQITNWAGICGFQKVHADQHFILYENASEVWVCNDGGVYKTENANTNNPAFAFRGNQLNITQYYAADLHPGSGVNQYLAGAQDNGTQFYQTSGVNNTTEVTGGDGMFCHIDQTNGNIQIASYTNQNLYVTLNGWQTQTQGVSGTKGRFANPTDYDDAGKKLYSADASGTYLRWNNPSSGGNSTDVVSVTGFPSTLSDNGIWLVRVSPNTANKVYFGFDGGMVVRVDNAHTGTSRTGKVVMNLGLGSGHVVSCVEIEEGNENHVLVTLSNYGITSIYESKNATAATPTWTAVEGNLPDMPVRWAMFNPNNSDQAFIATELGVWSTTNLNGGNTDWDPTNLGLSNTRIDMIKYRKSDKQMVVATHGRGLYTSDALNPDCGGNQNLSGSLAGTYGPSSTLTVTNGAVNANTTLSAETVILNPAFTVNPGKLFTIETVGCP